MSLTTGKYRITSFRVVLQWRKSYRMLEERDPQRNLIKRIKLSRVLRVWAIKEPLDARVRTAEWRIL
jgi:hypothetical protein